MLLKQKVEVRKGKFCRNLCFDWSVFRSLILTDDVLRNIKEYVWLNIFVFWTLFLVYEEKSCFCKSKIDASLLVKNQKCKWMSYFQQQLISKYKYSKIIWPTLRNSYSHSLNFNFLIQSFPHFTPVLNRSFFTKLISLS